MNHKETKPAEIESSTFQVFVFSLLNFHQELRLSKQSEKPLLPGFATRTFCDLLQVLQQRQEQKACRQFSCCSVSSWKLSRMQRQCQNNNKSQVKYLSTLRVHLKSYGFFRFIKRLLSEYLLVINILQITAFVRRSKLKSLKITQKYQRHATAFFPLLLLLHELLCLEQDVNKISGQILSIILEHNTQMLEVKSQSHKRWA